MMRISATIIVSDISKRKERTMRVRFVSLPWVLAAVAVMVVGLVFCLLGTSNATGQYQSAVIPRVNVETGGSLSIAGGTTGENNVIDFGNLGPGQPLEKTLSLGITANSAWHLTVSKNQDLHDSLLDATIPSTNFTFKSNGDSGPTYVTTNTQFGSSVSPSNVATNGSATTGSNVNVVYSLTIPGDQPCNDPQQSYYSAVHTYTLVVGSP
jgi:hypothetical protein